MSLCNAKQRENEPFYNIYSSVPPVTHVGAAWMRETMSKKRMKGTAGMDGTVGMEGRTRMIKDPRNNLVSTLL